MPSHFGMEVVQMTVSKGEFRRRRVERWLKAGTTQPAAAYLAEVEANGTLDKPISTLEELSKTPRWPGRRVYLAKSGRQLVWSDGIWQLQNSNTTP